MSRFFIAAAATAGVFVLEGCKNEECKELLRLGDEYNAKMEALIKREHSKSDCESLQDGLIGKAEQLNGKAKGRSSDQKKVDEQSAKFDQLYDQCVETATKPVVNDPFENSHYRGGMPHRHMLNVDQ